MNQQFKVKTRVKLEVAVIIASFFISTMIYGYMVGVPLPVLYTGLFTEDLATFNCQKTGHSGCLDNPNSTSCMAGYKDDGSGTCVLAQSNPPQSSVGSASCPYGTVKDSRGQCVSAIPTTNGKCDSGQSNIGGYCVSNDIAKYGNIPVSSSTTTTKCDFTYNLVAMALSQTPTVCNPISGDTSQALADFNNAIHNCGQGYHWAQDLVKCVKDDAPTGSAGGGGNTNTSSSNGNTNSPSGQGTTNTCQNIDPTSGLCLDGQNPYGSGDVNSQLQQQIDALKAQLASSGSGNNQLQAQIIQLLAQQQAFQQQQANQQNPFLDYINKNPLVIMFVFIAIGMIIFLSRLFKKNK